MRFAILALVSFCSGKGIKLTDILDAAKHGKAENESSENSLYGNLRARLAEEDLRGSRLGSRRPALEQWEALWSDGAIPDRPEIGVYPGAVATSHSTLNDLASSAAFEGIIVTWDCGNNISLAQTLSGGQQSGQAALFADALGTSYGVAGLIMDPTVAGQERCPQAIPATANGSQKDQITIWRRVVGAQDTLIGKVYHVHLGSNKITTTGHLRVLRNVGQTEEFEAVQLLTSDGVGSQIYAATILNATATAEPAAFPIFPIAPTTVAAS